MDEKKAAGLLLLTLVSITVFAYGLTIRSIDDSSYVKFIDASKDVACINI